jgi:hypothetical protein
MPIVAIFFSKCFKAIFSLVFLEVNFVGTLGAKWAAASRCQNISLEKLKATNGPQIREENGGIHVKKSKKSWKRNIFDYFLNCLEFSKIIRFQLLDFLEFFGIFAIIAAHCDAAAAGRFILKLFGLLLNISLSVSYLETSWIPSSSKGVQFCCQTSTGLDVWQVVRRVLYLRPGRSWIPSIVGLSHDY